MEQHVPVLREEVVEQLAIRPDGRYVDASFGRGGHSRAILERLGPGGRLLAIDRDPDAVRAARRLAAAEPRLQAAQGRFSELRRCVAQHFGDARVHGILLDLGVSSPQLDDPQRGFSFLRDGPLDMRMTPGEGQSAADWLASASESEIARVLRQLGEEPAARRIARAICERRAERPVETTGELAELIAACVPARPGRHPATRAFQAIRMHINRELEELEQALNAALDLLEHGGRLCVISFHSLEDRRVKRFLRDHSRVDPALADLPVVPPGARPKLRRPARAIRPSAEEIASNPRARSATLRSGERL